MDTVRVVVALGKIAFDTYLTTFAPRELALPKPLPKFGHLVTYALDGGVTLIGSYHPSQQNTQTGRLTHEMFDAVFAHAKELLDRPMAIKVDSN
jgi:uracil-DNA glycosylase